jgi:hypothetical protein
MAFHAHYAAVLTILAEVTWWLLSWQRLSMRPWKLPAISLCATGALCAPVIVNYLWQRASLFQGLSWIPATTWSGALSVLAQSSGGLAWVYAVLPAALALWLWGTWRRTNGGQGRLAGRIRAAPEGGHALLALWLVGAWVGLLAISWLVKPAMIARYALPSAVPALLLPLAVAARLHARAPLVLALVFVAARAPDWLRHGSETPPGFREMIEYLNAHAEPRTAGVAILIDEVTHPGWADMQRLGFDYYPLRDLPVYDLTLSSGGAPSNEALLADPRTLYVVAFLGDPLPLIHTAGRTIRPFQIDGASYTQLLFTPYRLVQVAPLASAMAPSGGAGHAPSSVFARGSPVDGGVGSGSAIR